MTPQYLTDSHPKIFGSEDSESFRSLICKVHPQPPRNRMRYTDNVYPQTDIVGLDHHGLIHMRPFGRN